MKRLLPITLLLLLLAGTCSTAYAQVPTRARLVDVREEARGRREEVKARVKNLRDERKLRVVARIQERINSINKRRTEHFMRVLDRLVRILDKIQSRSDKAKTAGKDVSKVETAIAAAKTAIGDARNAVAEQVAQTYTIVVNDETTARNDIGATVKKLQEDLRSVRDQYIKPAREAVRAALRQLKSIRGVDKEEATPTTTPATAP